MDKDNTFTYVEDNKEEINTKDEENKVTNEQKSSEEQTQAFVTGLPDWDLTPPYEVVRRVIR